MRNILEVCECLGSVQNVSELCEMSQNCGKCVKSLGIVQNLGTMSRKCAKCLGGVQNVSQVCLENCANANDDFHSENQ